MPSVFFAVAFDAAYRLSSNDGLCLVASALAPDHVSLAVAVLEGEFNLEISDHNILTAAKALVATAPAGTCATALENSAFSFLRLC